MRTTADIRRERLEKDPAFREHWERTALARAVANALIHHRAEYRWSQTRLAQEMGMRQPQVARLESGEHPLSFETLQRVSHVLGLRFIVELSPSSPLREQDPLSLPLHSTILEEVTTTTGDTLRVAVG